MADRVMHSLTWTGTLHATSSVAHGGETRATTTLLRRERILRDGVLLNVPIVSGNSWRGRLRRMAEEQLREVVKYEGQLTLAAAHTLRAGGSLAKSSTALTGARLQSVRELVPPLAVFGGAVGRTIEGSLQVGKLVPHLEETSHLTGVEGPSMFSAVQLETYTRIDEADRPGTASLVEATPTPLLPDGSPDQAAIDALPDSVPGAMAWRLETLPAGTSFSGWLRLEHVSPRNLAFFLDLLDRFSTAGHIGGRSSTGHGQVASDLRPTTTPPAGLPDWRAELHERRDDVLDAIALLG